MKNITGPELTAEFQRARSKWPFIHQTELAHGLPRMLLFAIGSRETNLTNEVGVNSYTDPSQWGKFYQALVSRPRTFGLTLGYSFK